MKITLSLAGLKKKKEKKKKKQKQRKILVIKRSISGLSWANDSGTLSDVKVHWGPSFEHQLETGGGNNLRTINTKI